MTSEEKRIMDGLLFRPGDPQLKAIKLRSHNLCQAYNSCREDETEKREALLREILGEIGEGTFLQGPVTFHYGRHTRIGKHTFINFHFTVQDDAPVTIGDCCDFGPNITIVTPLHPMLADERRAMLDQDGRAGRFCYAKPVVIGNNCWFGASVTVCPGVTIGDNAVIGAGSVVTKDIPPDTFAAGVPCRVIRRLTEADSMRHRPEILGGCRVME